MVATIKKILLDDWDKIDFVIGTNPEDLIEIKFLNHQIDSKEGLKVYMNNLINLNERVQAFDLRRVVHYWGFEEKKYIYYMLAPCWVHL